LPYAILSRRSYHEGRHCTRWCFADPRRSEGVSRRVWRRTNQAV